MAQREPLLLSSMHEGYNVAFRTPTNDSDAMVELRSDSPSEYMQDVPLDFSMPKRKEQRAVKAESPPPRALRSPERYQARSNGSLSPSFYPEREPKSTPVPDILHATTAYTNGSHHRRLSPNAYGRENCSSVPSSSSPSSAFVDQYQGFSGDGFGAKGGGDPHALFSNGSTFQTLSTEELLHVYKDHMSKLRDIEKRHRLFLTSDSSPPLPSSAILTAIPNSSRTLSPSSNTTKRRPRALPDSQKDVAYWERRRKNNEAAKRSRDARRAKEEEIAIRAAILEQENLKLRVEVAALKNETAKLKCMLYNN